MRRLVPALLVVSFGVLAGCLPASAPPTAAPDPPSASPAPPVAGTDRPFRADSLWNSPIPAGATWRDEPSLRADHWWINYESYSIPVVRATEADPLVAVTVPDSWGWPAGTLHLHVPVGVTGADGTDGSLVVVSDGIAYNFWVFDRIDATHASALAHAQDGIVDGTGFGSASPFRGAGIRAAGSSALAGLITGDDVGGGIDHALAISLLGTELRPGFVAPAISDDGGGYSGTIPMGSRLGIPAGTPMPSGLSPFGQSLWRALQQYGAFAVDRHGGTTPVILYADPFSVAADPVETARVFWNGGPSDLDRIMPYLRVMR